MLQVYYDPASNCSIFPLDWDYSLTRKLQKLRMLPPLLFEIASARDKDNRANGALPLYTQRISFIGIIDVKFSH